jgi:AhpD family alkylhydroperoxidase
MRIPPRRISAYPWYIRPFLWRQQRKYGAILDSALLWARAPRLFFGVAVLYGMIDRKSSPIDPALRSMITVRVSQINGCSFCVDLNSATLLQRGASLEKVEVLSKWEESDLFNDRECTALGYAEAMTRSDRDVGDEMFMRLRKHFDDDAIVEITGLIAFQNMSSKFNSALGVSSQGFCQVPGAALRSVGETAVNREPKATTS